MANISVRNQGRVRNHHNLACPAFAAVFVPSRALAYPCLTALFGLDKTEIEPAEKTCGTVLPTFFPREVSGLASSVMVLGPV